MTPDRSWRILPIYLLFLLLPLTFVVDLVLSQDPLPDGFLESNHVWSGTFDSAMFGSSVADAGDVNGDGFSDIVVGAYGWDVPGGLFDEGAAFVFLGGPDGIVGTDPTTANAVLLGDQATSEFGNSVAGAGDVNGDGFDDIIVGAHHYTGTIAGTNFTGGAAFLFYGSAAGITGTGPATADASIFASVTDARLGHVVSGAGDVNNDGFADIIVGCPLVGVPFGPGGGVGGSGNGGAALIFLGSASGITGSGFDDADRVIFPYPPGQPVASLEQLGAGVAAAGDVNNDGFDDVLVGAGGYITVFHGSAAGIVGRYPGEADAVITSMASIGIGALVAGAGDVNGDGFDDIMASDTGYPTGVTSGGHGAFMVFHGSASGITATSPADADTFIEGDNPIVILGPVQRLGWRLSGAGDVDGDGFGDVIVGGLEYPGSLDLEGIAYLFRGSATGLVGSTLQDAYLQLTPGQAGAAYRSNKPGFDVAGVGDINGDGFADVLMGAAQYDAGEAEEGVVFVYHGAPGSGGPTNQAPVAYGGTDQSVQDADGNGSEEITLDGSGSFDPDGSIVSYEWFSGSTLLGTGAVLTTTLPTAGTQSVVLSVTDDAGSTGIDALTVRVEPPTDTFILNESFTSGLGDWVVVGDVTLVNDATTFPDSPHAQLGASGASMRLSIAMPAGSTGMKLRFWGRASQFGVSDELLFNVSVDGGRFTTFDTLRPQDEGLNDDVYHFYGGSVGHGPVSTTWVPAIASNVVLEIESNMSTGVFLIDSIEVRALIGNLAPVADAGPDQSAEDSDGDGVEFFTLDGSACFDSNGSIVSYEWRDGPTLLGSTASVAATLSVGVHNVILTVTDNEGETASDAVVITVVSTQGNQPPVAVAGPAQAVTDVDNDGVELITLDGSGSFDPDGAIVSYQWSDAVSTLGFGVTTDVLLPVGETVVTLRVSDDGALESFNTTVITILPAPPAADFLRGDCNADGGVDISDPILLLERLFGAATAPDCEDSCDGNDDGNLDLADVIAMLDHIFINGAALPEPASVCGPDPVSDALTCSATPSCP
ncbi:MAG: PKD domain-containing protein [bacterium]